MNTDSYFLHVCKKRRNSNQFRKIKLLVGKKWTICLLNSIFSIKQFHAFYFPESVHLFLYFLQMSEFIYINYNWISLIDQYVECVIISLRLKYIFNNNNFLMAELFYTRVLIFENNNIFSLLMEGCQ